MSQYPILQTKLYIPPVRPELVSRPRLIERLNEGLGLNQGSGQNQGFGRKLTLISAPAGYGKTTLASEWVAGCERLEPKVPVAWLSLDDGDNELARFLTYLVAALQTIAAEFGQGVMAMLHSPQPPPAESILTALLNEITTIPEGFVLVLDDYHVLDANPVDAPVSVDGTLTFLLEHLPPRMHLVIATREDPGLPLARLRVRGQLTEVRVTDLRFTPSEAAGFLNQVMGLNLSAGDIDALEARTEGWIAGLQMAALALQGLAPQGPRSMRGRADTARFIQAFTGSHRFVMDYLVEEILHQQPGQVRDFLLQTSILDRLCGPLCDAVCFGIAETHIGQGDGRGMLEALERGNLFVVPLDDRRQWYRYHHLFADVLQAHLMEERPDQVPTLHRRASEWYEQHGSPPDAVRHALAAGDFERAAGLIELAWPAMDSTFQAATWLDWAKALPDELVRARPVLSTCYAWALLETGEMEANEARLRDAERWLDMGAEAGEPPGTLLTGTGPGVLPEPVEGPGRRARPEVPPEPVEGPIRRMVVVDQDQFRSLPSSIATARAYRALALDDVRGTVKYARQALDLLPEGDHQWRGAASSLLGLAQHASGDLVAAERSLAGSLAEMQEVGNVPSAISLTFVLADVRVVLGRLTEAASAYLQSLQLAASQGEPPPLGTSDLYRGMSELYLERGDLEAAAGQLQTGRRLGEQAALTDWQCRLCVAQARLKVALGDLDGAVDLLDEAERLYVRNPVPEVRPIAALRARVWARQGRWAEALAWARERDLSVDDVLGYPREYEHITLARVLIARYRSDRAEGSIHEAMELLERLLKTAEDGGRMGRAIELLVLQALALEAQGDMPGALDHLERALTLAEPEGYVRIFVDEGPPVARLLVQLQRKGVAVGYVTRLLAAFEGAMIDDADADIRRKTEPGSSSSVLGPSSLVEPLSKRELEVLRLLGAELSGPEIARELVVSLNTMRTHTKNIYSKLGVNNRRAAVRRAEEFDLL